jgi:SAM-dependent methyltransferase
MHLELTIPDSAVKYILFQRTDNIRFTNNYFYRNLKRLRLPGLFSFAVRVESYLRRREIKSSYANSIRNEFETISNYLPQSCSSILDIGCGIGAINVLLYQHYTQNQGDVINLYLLDKTKVDSNIHYGFNPVGEFYNSLQLTRRVLLENGIPAPNINLIDANENNSIPIRAKLDLVTSYFSWGFHYPVTTYLETVYDMLNSGGRLILDVRNTTQGVDEITNRFDHVEEIFSNHKYTRIMAVK